VHVRLLAFASAADAVGAPEQRLEVTGAATVGALRETLAARFPALLPLLPRLAVAVNGEVVGDAAAIADGAEVALLPPVSGG
jgi:MoaE-MoaD fusion protein